MAAGTTFTLLKRRNEMTKFIALTSSKNNKKLRVSVDHIVFYAPISEFDAEGFETEVVVSNNKAPIRVTETVNEIDVLIRAAR